MLGQVPGFAGWSGRVCSFQEIALQDVEEWADCHLKTFPTASEQYLSTQWGAQHAGDAGWFCPLAPHEPDQTELRKRQGMLEGQ